MRANAQLLVFRLDERYYAIRLSQVERVIRSADVTPVPQAPGIVIGMINLHGEIVPVVNTRKKFRFAEKEIGVDDQFVIARTSNHRILVLVVDAVVGITDRPAEEIIAAERIVPHLEHIEGVMQLAGDLILIHDLDRFLSLEEERTLEQALTSHAIHEC